MRFAALLLSLLASAPLAAAEPEPAKDHAAATACDDYGRNFIALPDTGICVAGGAIAELTGQASRLSRGPSQEQIVFHGALAADARTQTGWGELRAFARVSYYSDSQSWTPDYLFVSLTGAQSVGQIGISDSTFNYLGGGPSIGTLRSANLSAKLLRFTHVMSPGWTAKISVEMDPTERPRSVADPIARILPQAVPQITSNDASVVDLVGALLYEPKAGSAQLSAVLHPVRSPDPRIAGTFGYAVQFGMTLPLDFTAPAKTEAKSADSSDDDDDDSDDDSSDENGDGTTPALPVTPWSITHSFAWQIAYAKGATLYLGYGTGRFSKAAVDAVIVPGGTLELISGVSVMAYYTIGWMPKINQNIFGSWSQLNPPSAAIGFNLQGTRSYQETRIGTNFVYEPVKDLTLTLEAMAMKVDLTSIRNGVATQLANGTTAYQVSLQVTKIF